MAAAPRCLARSTGVLVAWDGGYASEHAFDLLVIGRHGNGGVLHPKLGHIAQVAARESKVPVLLVGGR